MTRDRWHQIELILYVNDQQASAEFYRKLLQLEPELDVPGMTEFRLNQNTKLGLMPSHGIARLLGNSIPHPDEGSGIPRCELYLPTDDAQADYERAGHVGAKPISEASRRNWGDVVSYVADPDGHIIAFAEIQ